MRGRSDAGTIRRVSPSSVNKTWIALGWVIAILPVIGWLCAQTLPGRIAQPSEFTGAYVRTLAASVFAVILLASAVINASIVSRRSPGRPSSYRWGRLGAAQAILLGAELGWLASLLFAAAAVPAEPILALAMAVASCVVFTFAVRRDREAMERL